MIDHSQSGSSMVSQCDAIGVFFSRKKPSSFRVALWQRKPLGKGTDLAATWRLFCWESTRSGYRSMLLVVVWRNFVVLFRSMLSTIISLVTSFIGGYPITSRWMIWPAYNEIEAGPPLCVMCFVHVPFRLWHVQLYQAQVTAGTNHPSARGHFPCSWGLTVGTQQLAATCCLVRATQFFHWEMHAIYKDINHDCDR